MELRERAERLVCPKVSTATPTPSHSTKTLYRHERNCANCRWMRGAMCFLAVICYGLSLFEIGTYTGDFVVHVLILFFSLAGEAAVFSVYRSRAALHGMRSHAGPEAKWSVMHSPSYGKMFLEMIVWIVQCPPGFSHETPWASALDSFIILRFYVFLCYFSNVTHTALFPRALASLAQVPLRRRFFLRSVLLLENLVVTVSSFAFGLLLLAFFYTRAEGVAFSDAVYFCCNTAAFVGFGDVAPSTFGGRMTAVCAWVLGVCVLCWAIGAMRSALRMSDAERNLHALFRSNELCALLPPQAARLIQRAWRLRVAKRKNAHAFTRHLAAFLMTQQALFFRDMRRELRAAESVFLRSTYTEEDWAFAATPPGRSPLGSPRTRRPFPSSQKMRSKAELRQAAAVGAATPAPRSPLSVRSAGQNVASVAELERRLGALEGVLERLAITAERLDGDVGMHISV